jgi:hypothetical protein
LFVGGYAEVAGQQKGYLPRRAALAAFQLCHGDAGAAYALSKLLLVDTQLFAALL